MTGAAGSAKRTKGQEPSRRALGDGAAQGAPTAPHATPRKEGGARTGPERFWSRWPVRLAFGASLVVSGLAHCSVVPLEVPRGFEVQDVDGEAAIPVDILAPDDPPPPPPESIPAAPDPTPPPTPTAGAGVGALLRDGGADAVADAATDAPTDARTDGPGLDGAIASAEAGAPSGPRDPMAIVGAAGDIQVDKVLVLVVVNAEIIRKSPVGANLGSLLRGIPQWEQFMHGTDIDPVADVDWLMVSGPSLVNTSRDVVLIRYGAPDAKVARAMDVVAGHYAQGGEVDAGAPVLKAVRSFADGAERVVLQPRSHVLAVVPSSAASRVARQLAGASVPAHIRPGEAAYIRVVDPHHPMPELPPSLLELRLRVVPRPADDGAEVYVEGDTKTPEEAAQAAVSIRAIIDDRNANPLVSVLTGGLLDHVEVASDGKLVKAHVSVSRSQIVTLIGLAAAALGLDAPAPPGASGPSPIPALPRAPSPR